MGNRLQLRPLAKTVELSMCIKVSEIEGGVSLNIFTEGCDRVPFKLEFCFTPGYAINGESFMMTGEAGCNVTAKSGFVEVRDELDSILVGPAFANHFYTSAMRGSEPPSNQEFTVYFTDFTNLDRTVTIKKV